MRDSLYKAVRWLVNQIFKAPYIDDYEPVPRVLADLATNRITMVKAADLNPARHVPTHLEVMLAPHIDVGEDTRDYGDIASRLQSQGEEG